MTWFRVLLADDRPEKVGAKDSNTKGRGPGPGLNLLKSRRKAE